MPQLLAVHTFLERRVVSAQLQLGDAVFLAGQRQCGRVLGTQVVHRRLVLEQQVLDLLLEHLRTTRGGD